MGSTFKTPGIDVAIHTAESGCGNPCHPAHACSSCEPFWQKMKASGQINTDAPTTFVGSATKPKVNLGMRKTGLDQPVYRIRQLSN
jgi:hypothetical protein